MMLAFVRKYTVVATILMIALCLGYMLLAITKPQTATALGIGYICLVFALSVLIRASRGSDAS